MKVQKYYKNSYCHQSLTQRAYKTTLGIDCQLSPMKFCQVPKSAKIRKFKLFQIAIGRFSLLISTILALFSKIVPIYAAVSLNFPITIQDTDCIVVGNGFDQLLTKSTATSGGTQQTTQYTLVSGSTNSKMLAYGYTSQLLDTDTSKRCLGYNVAFFQFFQSSSFSSYSRDTAITLEQETYFPQTVSYGGFYGRWSELLNIQFHHQDTILSSHPEVIIGYLRFAKYDNDDNTGSTSADVIVYWNYQSSSITPFEISNVIPIKSYGFQKFIPFSSNSGSNQHVALIRDYREPKVSLSLGTDNMSPFQLQEILVSAAGTQKFSYQFKSPEIDKSSPYLKGNRVICVKNEMIFVGGSIKFMTGHNSGKILPYVFYKDTANVITGSYIQNSDISNTDLYYTIDVLKAIDIGLSTGETDWKIVGFGTPRTSSMKAKSGKENPILWIQMIPGLNDLTQLNIQLLQSSHTNDAFFYMHDFIADKVRQKIILNVHQTTIAPSEDTDPLYMQNEQNMLLTYELPIRILHRTAQGGTFFNQNSKQNQSYQSTETAAPTYSPINNDHLFLVRSFGRICQKSTFEVSQMCQLEKAMFPKANPGDNIELYAITDSTRSPPVVFPSYMVNTNFYMNDKATNNLDGANLFSGDSTSYLIETKNYIMVQSLAGLEQSSSVLKQWERISTASRCAIGPVTQLTLIASGQAGVTASDCFSQFQGNWIQVMFNSGTKECTGTNLFYCQSIGYLAGNPTISITLINMLDRTQTSDNYNYWHQAVASNSLTVNNNLVQTAVAITNPYSMSSTNTLLLKNCATYYMPITFTTLAGASDISIYYLQPQGYSSYQASTFAFYLIAQTQNTDCPLVVQQKLTASTTSESLRVPFYVIPTQAFSSSIADVLPVQYEFRMTQDAIDQINEMGGMVPDSALQYYMYLDLNTMRQYAIPSVNYVFESYSSINSMQNKFTILDSPLIASFQQDISWLWPYQETSPSANAYTSGGKFVPGRVYTYQRGDTVIRGELMMTYIQPLNQGYLMTASQNCKALLGDDNLVSNPQTIDCDSKFDYLVKELRNSQLTSSSPPKCGDSGFTMTAPVSHLITKVGYYGDNEVPIQFDLEQELQISNPGNLNLTRDIDILISLEISTGSWYKVRPDTIGLQFVEIISKEVSSYADNSANLDIITTKLVGFPDLILDNANIWQFKLQSNSIGMGIFYGLQNTALASRQFYTNQVFQLNIQTTSCIIEEPSILTAGTTYFNQLPTAQIDLDISMVDCTVSTLTLLDSAPALITVAKNQASTSSILVLTQAQLLAYFSHSVSGCVHTADIISTSSWFALDAGTLMLKSTVSTQSAPEEVSVSLTAKIAVHQTITATKVITVSLQCLGAPSVATKVPLPAYAQSTTVTAAKFKIVLAKDATLLTVAIKDVVSWGTEEYCGPESLELCATSACTSLASTGALYTLATNPTPAVIVANVNVLDPELSIQTFTSFAEILYFKVATAASSEIFQGLLIVCGQETLEDSGAGLADKVKLITLKQDATTSSVIDLSQSTPTVVSASANVAATDCPVVSWVLCSDSACSTELSPLPSFMSFDSSYTTLSISQAVAQSFSGYLAAKSAGAVYKAYAISVDICVPFEVTAGVVKVEVAGGARAAVDLSPFFTGMTTQCPITAYSIVAEAPMQGAAIPVPATPSLVIDANTAGVYKFSVNATSAAGHMASKAFEVTVAGAAQYLEGILNHFQGREGAGKDTSNPSNSTGSSNSSNSTSDANTTAATAMTANRPATVTDTVAPAIQEEDQITKLYSTPPAERTREQIDAIERLNDEFASEPDPVLGPLRPPVPVASDEQMEEFAERMQQQAALARLEKLLKEKQQREADQAAGVETEAPPAPPPLGYELSPMSRDGRLSMKFNSKLLTPPFVSALGSRRLQEGAPDLSSIDASKLFEAGLHIQSDEALPDLQYFFVLKEWTDQRVDLQFNFSSPLAISQGASPDKLQIRVSANGAKYFVSAGTLEPLNCSSQPKTAAPVDRQLPLGLSAKKLDDQVQQSSTSVTAIIILQVAGQVVVKGSLDHIWDFYLQLQLFKALRTYDLPYPGQVAVTFEQAAALVDFKMIKPDFVLHAINPEWSISSLLKIPIVSAKEASAGAAQASGLSESMLSLLTVGLLMVTGLLLAALAALLLRRYREKITKALVGAKDKFFWGGFVRSQSLAYATTAVQLASELRYWKATGDGKALQRMGGLTAWLLAYPLFCGLFLWNKNRESLETPDARAKYGKLYQGVSLKKGKLARLYYPFFLVRRFLFIVPVGLIAVPSLELAWLMLLSMLYIMLMGATLPRQFAAQNTTELAFEALLVVVIYPVFTFTAFNRDLVAQFNMGYAFLGCFICFIATAFGTIGHNMRKAWQRKRYLKLLADLALAAYKERCVFLMNLADVQKAEAARLRGAARNPRVPEEQKEQLYNWISATDYVETLCERVNWALTTRKQRAYNIQVYNIKRAELEQISESGIEFEDGASDPADGLAKDAHQENKRNIKQELIDRGELVTLDMLAELLRKQHGISSPESLDQETDRLISPNDYTSQLYNYGEISVSNAASVWPVLGQSKPAPERKALLRQVQKAPSALNELSTAPTTNPFKTQTQQTAAQQILRPIITDIKLKNRMKDILSKGRQTDKSKKQSKSQTPGVRSSFL